MKKEELPKLSIGEEMMLKMHQKPTMEEWKNTKNDVVLVGENEDGVSKDVFIVTLLNKAKMSKGRKKRKSRGISLWKQIE